MKFATIRDADIKDKTVLIRTDYNVPLEEGSITSDLRIRASLPTLDYLRKNGAKKIIVISHLGRPEGHDAALSLKPIASRLNELVEEVDFVGDVAGAKVAAKVAALPKGGILVLENLRFYEGEEANSGDFIKSIIDATGADLFVQDGFAVVHRAHASVAAVADYLPAYAGLLLEKEINGLSKAIDNPSHPLVVIIGGAKVDDKKPLIDTFLGLADKIIVGGKIAADGYEATNDKIYVASDFDEDSEGHKLDVGPVSTVEIAKILENAKTVVWNGLMGKAEDPAYATSSTVIAEILGEKTECETIICGGDTTGFVEEMIEEHDLHFSLISTGGGAALEFLTGKELPGIKALQ